jgi:plasmid stabilization system protein ParE
MIYEVLLTAQAEAALERLFEYVLQREEDRTDGRLELAEEALGAIKAGLKVLERFPFTCRKAATSPFLRELVIPFGGTGCVALFEIADAKTVIVTAIRHQREDDCH